MQVIATELDDCYIIEPDVYGDNRGYFMESHNEKKLQEHGLNYHFVQGNESFTAKKGTIRGLHFQTSPMTQGKLVRCLTGKIYDVAVDLRKDSKTYKKWIKVELSGENKRQLLMMLRSVIWSIIIILRNMMLASFTMIQVLELIGALSQLKNQFYQKKINIYQL